MPIVCQYYLVGSVVWSQQEVLACTYSVLGYPGTK